MTMKLSGRIIAVTGAGIAGLCAAFALRARGAAVTLFDPNGFPPDGASRMAGGMLAPHAEIEHMPAAFISAGLAGIECWAEILEAAGAPGLLRRQGSLLVAHPEDRPILERFAGHLPRAGQDRKVDEAMLRALEPDLAHRFRSGLFLPEEAHLDPVKTMEILSDYLSKQNVSLKKERVDIEALQPLYDHIIDCRGFGAMSDDPSLRGVKGEILVVENRDFTLTRPVRLMHPRYPLYIVPRPDHIFMIGATVIESGGSNGVAMRSAMELMSALYSLHPSFGEARMLDIRAGVRPAYPDNLPRLTKADGKVIRINGLFRHGYLLGPVITEALADNLEEKDNAFLPLFMRTHDKDYHQRKSLEPACAA